MRIPSLGAGVVAILAFAVLTLGGSPGQQGESLPGGIGARSAAAPAGHVGSKACAGCHERQAKDWASSHHAHAMATATGATVRGDFSGPSVTVSGSKGRFFRDGATPTGLALTSSQTTPRGLALQTYRVTGNPEYGVYGDG